METGRTAWDELEEENECMQNENSKENYVHEIHFSVTGNTFLK
jgi:hypothetical protein